MATFPRSVIFIRRENKMSLRKAKWWLASLSGQQKLVLRHYIGMLFKPCKKSEGCCKLQRVVAESGSSFGKKICTCLLGTFYGPSVWRDSIKL